MITFDTVIENEVGLHARPAAVFVQTAGRFTSQIKIRKVKQDKPAVNGKSILHVLMLGVSQGETVEITVEGDDEEQAAAALQALIAADFARPEA